MGLLIRLGNPDTAGKLAVASIVWCAYEYAQIKTFQSRSITV